MYELNNPKQIRRESDYQTYKVKFQSMRHLLAELYDSEASYGHAPDDPYKTKFDIMSF